MTDYATGSCRCGHIKFKVGLPALWVAHCHCTLCQKSSGAAFVTWAGFKKDDYTIDDPRHFMKSFKSEKGERRFCSNCGTPFGFQYIPGGPVENLEWLNEVHFTVVNFNPVLEQKPTSNAHYKTRQQWIGEVATLPSHE